MIIMSIIKIIIAFLIYVNLITTDREKEYE